ncbi:MAG: DUF3365 domain-containing protein [Planctomycetota bacterium]|nr:DUF3365 domain-containing protein [Planctomycetota bacterium]
MFTSRRRVILCLAFVACTGSLLFVEASDEPVSNPDDVSATTKTTDSETHDQGARRVSIAVARDRAKLMHGIYLASLHTMHDRYFHADRAIVPARAMEDVFSEVERQTGSKANWISVNLRAMSINHEPTTDFEKRAAKEIAAGETDLEVIEDGFYRRAGAIPMSGGCVSCHGGFANKPSRVEKFTGLVISIPVVPADESSPAETGGGISTAIPRNSVAQARRQAEIQHTSIHATLQAVHDRYYREDEGLPIPASIMGDVFKGIEARDHIKLRWLAVEGQAMNTDHQPQDAFETEAVKSLKSGKPFYEQSENGLYRRAAPITLSNHCLKCHMPDRKSTRDRVAGLTIAISVEE